MGFSLTRVLAIVLLFAVPVVAQSNDYDDDRDGGGAGFRDEGTFSLKAGLGFTSSPTSLLLGFEGDYRVMEPVSVGLLTEVGLDDDVTIVSPQLFARYWPDLGELIDPDVAFLEPYRASRHRLQLVGCRHVQGRRRRRHAVPAGPGFGLDLRINKNLSVGTQMLFNIIPVGIHEDSPIDDQFYYSWEVVGLRLRF